MIKYRLPAFGGGRSVETRLMNTDAAQREKNTAAAVSVAVAVFLTLVKLVVGLSTRSLGILAEAAHSGLDLVAAVITLVAVRISDRPADESHLYGHGKVENFSAFVETLLLFATCTWIVFESVRRLFFRSVEVEPSLWAFLIVVVSILFDVERSRILFRVARKHSSQALEADALHFSTDVWSSAVVLAGLGLVWLGRNVLPAWSDVLRRADAVAALGVAVIVFFVSYRLGRRTLDVLLDRAPDGLKDRITGAALEVEGVVDTGQVRLRRSGARVFIDMNISVDRTLSFERTHAIAESVERAVREIIPGADVVIHTDPKESERESLVRRVRAVADSHGVPAHNITVVEDGGLKDIDLHIEVDDHLLLHQAHNLASLIEQELKRSISDVRRVNTHIESRGTGVGNGVDVTDGEAALVEAVRVIADRVIGRRCAHNIVIRRHDEKLSVSLHCGFDCDLPVREAHRLSTEVEEAVKREFPAVERVTVHTEPEVH